jgi:hypothetical protein
MGRGAHDRFSTESASGARPVLDNKGLAKSLRKQLSDKPRVEIHGTTGRKADDDVHRSRRIIECRCDARQNWKPGSAYGQMQKRSTGKFQIHHVPRVSKATSQKNTRPPALEEGLKSGH